MSKTLDRDRFLPIECEVGMRLNYVPVLGIFLLAPSTLAQDTGGVTPGDEGERKESGENPNVEELCKLLVRESQEIVTMLNSVSDQAGADHIAPKLRKMLDVMDSQLQTLSKLPSAGSENMQAIKVHMSSLTHISQNCLSAIRRLSSVGAYGSDALMQVLERYNMGEKASERLQPEDLPHTQLYNELADSLEDALFILRKVRNEADARDAVLSVQDLLEKIERTHYMLTQLAPPLTNEQEDMLLPVRDRMRTIRTELKKISDSLQASQYFNQPDLPKLLMKLTRAASS